MAGELTPQIEQYLTSVVASGLFPSEQAALEAAIDALREKTEPIPFVPDEHMARVEQAIESANAGRTSPMTPEYWESLRQIVRDFQSAGGHAATVKDRHEARSSGLIGACPDPRTQRM